MNNPKNYLKQRSFFLSNGALSNEHAAAIEKNAKRHKEELQNKDRRVESLSNAIKDVQKRLFNLQKAESSLLRELANLQRHRPTFQSHEQQVLFERKKQRASGISTAASPHEVLQTIINHHPLNLATLNALRRVNETTRNMVKYRDIQIESGTFVKDFFHFVKKYAHAHMQFFVPIERTLPLPNIPVDIYCSLEVTAGAINLKIEMIKINVINEDNEETELENENDNQDNHIYSIHINSMDGITEFTSTFPYHVLVLSHPEHVDSLHYSNVGVFSEAMRIFKPEVRRAINKLIRQILVQVARLPRQIPRRQ